MRALNVFLFVLIVILQFSLITLSSPSPSEVSYVSSICGDKYLLIVFSNGSVMVKNPFNMENLYYTTINFTKIIGIAAQQFFPLGSKVVPNSFEHEILVYANSSGVYGLILPHFIVPQLYFNGSNITLISSNFPSNVPITIKIMRYISNYNYSILNTYVVMYNSSFVEMVSLSDVILNYLGLVKSLNFTVYYNSTVLNNVIINITSHEIIYPINYKLPLGNLTFIAFHNGVLFYVINNTLYEDNNLVAKINGSVRSYVCLGSNIYVITSTGYLISNVFKGFVGNGYFVNNYIYANGSIFLLNLTYIRGLNFTPILVVNGLVIGKNLQTLSLIPLHEIIVKEKGLPSGTLWGVVVNGTIFYTTSNSLTFYTKNSTAFSFFANGYYYVSNYSNGTVYFSQAIQRLTIIINGLNYTPISLDLVVSPLHINGEFSLNVTSHIFTVYLPTGYYVLQYRGFKTFVNLTSPQVLTLGASTSTPPKSTSTHGNTFLIILLLISLLVLILIIIRNTIKSNH